MIYFQNVFSFLFQVLLCVRYYLLKAETKEGSGQNTPQAQNVQTKTLQTQVSACLDQTIFKTPDVHMVPTSQ